MQANKNHWRTSPTICALSDEERHLGHVVMTGGQWVAYDGTRLSQESATFRVIGTFLNPAAAMRAVEAIACAGRETMLLPVC